LKLIKQVQLFFQEGSSDKIYEIDLCETAPGEFVVNFRYGKRGAALKEGTKTVFPVNLQEAEKAFAALEQEKRKKGYASTTEAAIDETFVREKPNLNEKRRKAIVKALRLSVNGEEPENWKVSRIIWRAGELHIEEAEPHILKLADTSDPFNIYSVVWSLSRVGGPKGIAFLQKLKEDKQLTGFTQQLITDSLLAILPEEEKNKIWQAELLALPVPVSEAIQKKEFHRLSQLLHDYLINLKTSSNRFLISLYRLTFSDEKIKEAFTEVLHSLPFKPGTFRYLRQIFKVAEMRNDFTTYSILAKNIEKNPFGFRTSYGYVRNAMGQYVAQSEEIANENGTLAFSSKTKEYLTRRILRTLRKTAKIEEGYTELATSLLLAFRDENDITPPSSFTDYSYDYSAREYRNTIHHFDSYARFMVFNQILYTNSTRYIRKKKHFECVPPYEPGKPAPEKREEAFPKLWDRDAASVIRLLSESKVAKVHEFALKVMKANPEFVKEITSSHIKAFLISGYEGTARLGFEMAVKIYNPSDPDKNLVLALLESGIPEAVEVAKKWVNEQRSVFLGDTTFVLAMLLCKHPAVHAAAREWLSAYPMKGETGKEIVSKVLALLLNENEYNPDEAQINAISEILILGFEEIIRGLDLELLQLFIGHKSLPLQSLGARLLAKNRYTAEELPESFLLSLISSDNIIVRGIGLELFGQLSSARLMEKKNLLISLLISPLADLRNNVKPVLEKLIEADTAFARELADLLIPTLLMNETYEGVHEDIRKMLEGKMYAQLSFLDKKKILTLATSRNSAAQQIGCTLLKSNVKQEELTIQDLLKLAGNPQLDTREYIWSIFRNNPERIRKEKGDAIRLCDNYWKDTRAFAFAYFKEIFSTEDWTPEILVGLCDSVKEEVQAYGREMIVKSFQSEAGEYFLLALAQHPEAKMQLFTTNYLERFAGNNPETIAKLEDFFITLLSQVNKGRVAKARVLHFLKSESEKSKQSAEVAARIINRCSASISIQDKAVCVSLLLGIKQRYPEIDTVIRIKEVEVK
jgi:predicted DNA-binding WGR domain protein